MSSLYVKLKPKKRSTGNLKNVSLYELKKSQSLTEVDKNNTYDFISRKYSVKMSLKISNQYYTLRNYSSQ